MQRTAKSLVDSIRELPGEWQMAILCVLLKDLGLEPDTIARILAKIDRECMTKMVEMVESLE